MRKTFKYRLYPTREQARLLQFSLEACRWVYNKTIEIRKQAWENKRKSLSLYDTNSLLPQWKEEKSDLCNAFSQCLQNTQLRVDLAFKAFFRRCKAGEKPGYPRFRGEGWYDSLTFPQPAYGYKLVDGKLKLFKVGPIKIKTHRAIEGEIKTLTIRRTATNKWFACFSCEVERKPLQPSDAVVGIDVGLESFATLSTGEKIPNPRFFWADEKKLQKAQRKLSVVEKDSVERAKRRKIVAHVHEKITNRRKDFAHKLALTLVRAYGLIAFEKLNIKGMKENGFRGIRKSIGDVAWDRFMQFTVNKAESAGRVVALVNPCNTSKRCSRCGQMVEKDLSVRVHSCSCGLVMDRDHNAAINILALGLQGMGSIPRSSRL